MKFRLITLALGLSVCGLAFADPSFTRSHGDTLSALKSDAGLAWTETKYGVNFYKAATDPTLFINAINFIPGVSWDPNINLNTSTFFYGDLGSGYSGHTYELGTAINGEANWNFDGILRRSGVVNSSVNAGMYDFRVEIIGGNSDTAEDVLASFDNFIEVIPSLTAEATATMSPAAIGPNQISQASVEFHNSSNRDIKTTTWYVAGFGLGDPGNSDQLVLENFIGNWFNQTITPSSSRQDLHSSWKATPSNAPGVYQGNIGIIGGAYEGDWHGWKASGSSLEVVPEPATMLAVGLGIAGLLRRRRA